MTYNNTTNNSNDSNTTNSTNNINNSHNTNNTNNNAAAAATTTTTTTNNKAKTNNNNNDLLGRQTGDLRGDVPVQEVGLAWGPHEAPPPPEVRSNKCINSNCSEQVQLYVFSKCLHLMNPI